MKKIYLLCCLSIMLSLTACKKWLDVKPEGQKTTEEQFTSYAGFADALNGCYIKLKSRSIYGENLTMSYTESMAQIWNLSGGNTLANRELSQFNYLGDGARAAASAIYMGLYNTIAHTNLVINNIETNGAAIPDATKRSVILGEALAIRAFCHFDALRLFGSVPKNPTIQVSLPYAEEVSTTALPKYYTYSQYVAKLEADLTRAEELLDKNDPIFKATFSALNTVAVLGEDDFMKFRQNRFNYWAVKALQARFYLYTGNSDKAYTIARSIIDAKGADGNKLITLSGTSDIANDYLACPSESLMMLNVHNLIDYTPTLLATGTPTVLQSYLTLSVPKLDSLFLGQSTSSNNRYQKVWGIMQNSTGVFSFKTLRKYYYNTATAASVPINLTKRQVIPLIRLSEIYLIAIENTTNLSEANLLWQQYKESQNVLVSATVFSTLDAVKAGVIDEYRREFIGEGQMFFTYKRTGATAMLWKAGTITEANYVVPLPLTEFNPN